MRLGIMSDSHGQAGRVRRALDLFDRLGVAMVIHCGDIGGGKVLEVLAGRPCAAVWGNTDHPPDESWWQERPHLPRPQSGPVKMELAGRRILVFHGHESQFRQSLRNPEADYLLHGHTHAVSDERTGACRVINPGALYRAVPCTVAVLDLVTDLLNFHEIPG